MFNKEMTIYYENYLNTKRKFKLILSNLTNDFKIRNLEQFEKN